MSDIVPTDKPGQIAVRQQLTQAIVDEYLAEPLKQIPAKWRPHVLNFWMNFQALPGAPDMLAMLCARIRTWGQYGLLYTDLDNAFGSVLHPSRQGSWRYASDVCSAVTVIVARNMERRQSRAELEKIDKDRLSPDALHEVMQQLIARQRDPVDPPPQSDSSPTAPASDAAQAKRGPTPGPPRDKPRGSR